MSALLGDARVPKQVSVTAALHQEGEEGVVGGAKPPNNPHIQPWRRCHTTREAPSKRRLPWSPGRCRVKTVLPAPARASSFEAASSTAARATDDQPTMGESARGFLPLVSGVWLLWSTYP